MVRHATGAERKLQVSQYEGEKKGRDWDKFDAIYNEHQIIMGNLVDHDYNGIDNSTKIFNFLHGIGNIQFEAVVNIVCAQ